MTTMAMAHLVGEAGDDPARHDALLPAQLSGREESGPLTRLLEAQHGALTRAPLSLCLASPCLIFGYQVIPVSLQVLKDFRVSGALFLPDQPAPLPTILIPHGHFGEGKSSGESQAPAHAFARSGWAALTMDSPGVEEGDLPGRRIHLREGAGGRALLAAAGSSAKGAQLHCLQAARFLDEAGADLSGGVAGAPGGSGRGSTWPTEPR